MSCASPIKMSDMITTVWALLTDPELFYEGPMSRMLYVVFQNIFSEQYKQVAQQMEMNEIVAQQGRPPCPANHAPSSNLFVLPWRKSCFGNSGKHTQQQLEPINLAPVVYN